MQGNVKLVGTLNSLLADELTAVNQYMVHAEMCENWGYDRLHEHFRKRSIDEMKHAEKLISRILFLDGRPDVSKLRPIHIGAEVAKQFANDRDLELTAVKAYNASIAQSVQAGDNATRELLEGILVEEDRHIDGIEENLDQIVQMGLPSFLSAQLKK
jgi:bacterioferritin